MEEVKQFKVGDKVKRIAQNVEGMSVGTTWVVSNVDSFGTSIEVENLEGWWSADYFELVADDEYKVKVGETVRYLGNDTPRLKNGSKHKVIAVDRCGELTLQWVSGYWNPDDFEVVTEEDVSTTDGIVSDGGSSDYYFTKLPKHLIDKIVETGGIEIKDIARYVYDNNADAFNIIKAEKRIIEYKKGKGKAGTTMIYDANKIIFFANEQLEALTNEGNV